MGRATIDMVDHHSQAAMTTPVEVKDKPGKMFKLRLILFRFQGTSLFKTTRFKDVAKLGFQFCQMGL